VVGRVSKHITTCICTALSMSAAFARLRSLPVLCRRAGRRMLQILFAWRHVIALLHIRSRSWTYVQRIPDTVHRHLARLIRCPFWNSLLGLHRRPACPP
jgi:hypothetical protein